MENLEEKVIKFHSIFFPLPGQRGLEMSPSSKSFTYIHKNSDPLLVELKLSNFTKGSSTQVKICAGDTYVELSPI